MAKKLTHDEILARRAAQAAEKQKRAQERAELLKDQREAEEANRKGTFRDQK